MGNVPSKEPQGRPLQKLSKPRNATQATAGLLKPNGPSTTTKHPSDLNSDLISIPYSSTATPHVSADDDDDDDDKKGGNLNSDKRNSFLGPPKPQRRLSLFRSKSSQDASRRKSRRNTIVGAPANDLTTESPSVVRANSVNTHNLDNGSNRYSGLIVPENRSPVGCRASWAYDQSYEAQRVLNLVQEQPAGLPRSNTSTSLFTPRPEDMHTAAWRRRSLPVQPPESTPISRTNSELSLHPPMRRRSLIQTPGVATRSIRPGQINTRSSIRHSYMAAPNLSRRGSFETDDRVPSLPPLPTPFRVEGDVPRVATPKDGEYSTTGAFKFGTLRITNGSPDLTPADFGEAEELAPAVSSPDYFTAILPPTAGVTSETEADRVKASTLSAGPQTSDVTHETAKPDFNPSGKANVPTLSITVPTAGFESQFASGPQLSPIEFDQEPLFRRSLEIQTKHTADDDQLFDMEDDIHSEISTVEKLDVRLDPSAKGLPPQPLGDPTQPEAQGVKRTDSGFVSNSVSVSSTPHSSLTKADSGYSSNISLRSFRSGKKALATEDTRRDSAESVRRSPEIADKEPRHALELQFPSPIDAGDNPALRSSEVEKAPTPPPKDTLSTRQAGRSLPRNTEGDDTRARLMSSGARMRAVRQQLPNIDIGQNEDRNGKSPESTSPIPASAMSDASESASSLSIGSNSQKHGRLHRLLSMRGSGSSKVPLTVHVTHAVDKQVPSVPKEVEDKLREHTGRFPITTKRLALRSQMSKETLKTILSVGSLEFAMEDELPSTSSFLDSDSEDEKAHRVSVDASVRQTINSMQSNFKQAAVSMMPNRKSITRKPVPTREESRHLGTKPFENGLELTSYTSVQSSLGNNVLDVAAKAMTETQARPGRRAGRSMTLTAGQSNHLQLRTYSLNSMPSTPTPIPLAVSPPKKQKSSPPVSMATRSFRPLPPRSPVSPQGPAVLCENNEETIHNPTTNTSAVPSVPASASNYRAADWDPHAHHNILGSPIATSTNRHKSLTSAQSDLIQVPVRPHASGQQRNCIDLKQQSHLDEVVQNQLQTVYAVPNPAHQGPRTRSLSHSEPWGSSSKLVQGHQPNQRYPPYVPRGQNCRNLSAEKRPHNAIGNPPYRILHSYNSPAYRNAPIWG
ncbi:hypothetical protein VM1G_10123 [Cytospora mali]|uniref:Uncharacterized protein n=1 Tax=Cytospora mali TaxID=578113 RepID=A0A194WDN0_CYTMA|nr:hypothetical protein VM1G_10123 [Valsa mali]